MARTSPTDRPASSDREQALHRLRLLAEAGAERVLVLEPDGSIREISAACLRTVEANRLEEIPGQCFYSLLPEPSRESFRALAEKVFRGETAAHEFEIVGLKGARRWLEFHAGPLRARGPKVDALLAIAQDVTERKRAQDALAVKAELLTAVSESLAAYVERGDWRAAMGRLLRTALHLTQSEYGFVAVLMDGPQLRALAHEGFSWDELINRNFYQEALRRYEEVGYVEFTRFDNLFGRALTTGQVVIVNQPHSDPRSGGLPRGHPPLHNFLGVPISTGEQVVGLVALANRSGGYSEEEKSRIEVLVQHVHGLCATYRDREAALVLEQQRLQMEPALRASEQRLSLAVKAANVGLWDLDLHTQQVVFSREWKLQLGYDEDEVADDLSEWERRLHPDDAGSTNAQLRAYLSDPQGAHEVEFRMLHKNGTWRWIYSRGEAVRDADGRPSRMLGCHIDVTQRKLAEERIARLNRTHSVLSGISQVMLREREPQQILERACQVAVEKGRFKLAWIGLVHGSAGELQIAAHAGATPDTLEILTKIFSDPQQGCAFTFRALETGEHAVCNDIAADVLARPWREPALQRGYRSMVSLALTVSARRIGTLNLYAPEPNFFDAEELQLLDTLASDIAFALDSYERERDRAAALQQLRLSEERFRQIAETINDVFWISDARANRVLYISPAYEKIWGRTRESVYDAPSSWSDAVHPEDRPRIKAALDALHSHGNFNEEYRIRRPDGSERWIRDQVFPVRGPDGKIERHVGVARDITERKLLEAQVRQSQKMEAVGQLAGGIAHDFNNLIGTIVGNAELARMDLTEDHPAQESIREISRASKRAKDLVSRLLTFGRPTEHQLQSIDFETVVNEAVTLLRATLPAGVELRVRSSPRLPTVRADASQVHQVILNLVTNSWHAMDTQSGRIDISLEACNIDGDSEEMSPELETGNYVRMSVRDTGKGMDPATLGRIFEPFFTTKPQGLGTGLGLPVVQGIMRGFGGAITVESHPGRGSAFHLFFPATPDEACANPMRTPKSSDLLGRGQHILYVDDEEPLVHLATRFLTRVGYRVTAHTSAAQALSAFKSDPRAFDLVVTDFNMPEMSGLELALQMLRLRPDALVVLASGYLPADEVEKARRLGVREVIAKPTAMENLPGIVTRLVETKDRAKPQSGA
ncbi:MAG: PAS domain S-box protein [Steroidobacter sp.]